MTDPALDALDTALIGLRRLWDAPPVLHVPDLGAVEMSTIWVVDALARLPDHGEVTVSDVAAAIDVTHSTASRLIGRAEAAGCVRRERSQHDTRRTVVTATPAGRALATAAHDARTRYLADITAQWAPQDRAALSDLLARLAAAVHDNPPSHGGTQ